MEKDQHAATLFEGVFAADTLPTHVYRKPAYFIVNTDPVSKPGKHWIAITIDCHGHGEYFDSYGLPPYINNHQKFLNRHCKTWKFNNTDLQALDSTVCGQYCVMYLLHKSHGYSLNDFKTMYFSENCNKNDEIVDKMFQRYMANFRLCDDLAVKKSQSCCKRRKK